MPRSNKSRNIKLWVGGGVALLLIIVGIIIAIVMSNESDGNTGGSGTSGGGTGTSGGGTGTSGGGTGTSGGTSGDSTGDSGDSGGGGGSSSTGDTGVVVEADPDALAACNAEGGDVGFYLPNSHLLTEVVVAEDEHGHSEFNGEPILIPMQCAALCEATESCWGYTFGFARRTSEDGYTEPIAYCNMHRNPGSYDTSILNSDFPWLDYTGVKCATPKYNNQISNNYYTQYGERHGYTNTGLTYIEKAVVGVQAGGGGGGGGGTPVSRGAATTWCKDECNGNNECLGFELTMTYDNGTDVQQINTGSYTYSQSDFDNKWRCYLYEEGGLGMAIVKTQSNDESSCNLTQAASSYPDDLNNCTVVGLRMNKVIS